MADDIRKQRAFALLNQVLPPYVAKTLGTQQQITDPLRTMIVNWNTFSRVLSSSDLSLIKQLSAAQHNTNLSATQVDTIVNNMITLISHAHLTEHIGKFQQLLLSSSTSILPGGIESAALVGGLMAAGYFGYKLYEGACSMLEGSSSDSPQQNQQNLQQNLQQNTHQNLHNLQNQTTTTTNSTIPQQTQQNITEGDEDDDRESPFMCPITLQVMSDPVITPQGICFERAAILDWLSKSDQCPVTHTPLSADKLITCYAMRNAIEEYEKMRSSIRNISSPPARVQERTETQTNNTNRTERTEEARVHNVERERESERKEREERNRERQLSELIRIEITPAAQHAVHAWTGAKLQKEDECDAYPLRSMYVIFPASYFYLVSRSTGYVVIQNRSNFGVQLISRERSATLCDPMNEGGNQSGEYILRANSTQGFDFRGWYCIEVKPDVMERPIDLLITDFAMSGGGKGAWLKMGSR